MTKSKTTEARELARLLLEVRNGGRLTPSDAARKAELTSSVIGPAVTIALEAAKPRIEAGARRRAVRAEAVQAGVSQTRPKIAAAIARQRTQQRKR